MILIINKIDTIDKKKAPEILEAWEKVLAFDDIIVVSALRGLNVEEVIRAILKRLPEGPQ